MDRGEASERGQSKPDAKSGGPAAAPCGGGAPMEESVMVSIIDSIADGVVVANREGRLILCNRAAEEIVGIGLTDCLPQDWAARYGCFKPDMVTPLPMAEMPLVRAIAGETVDAVEVFIRNEQRPDGVWLSCDASPWLAADGTVAGGVVIFRDTSSHHKAQEEVRRLNAELSAKVEELAAANDELALLAGKLSEARDQALESSRLKSRLVTNFTHEVRTPLSVVMGALDLLRHRSLDKDLTGLVEQAYEAAGSLLAMIGNILDLSRLETGDVELARGNFSFSAAMTAAVAPLSRQAMEKGLSFAVRIASDVPSKVGGDERRFLQVVTGLVGNAVNLTGAGAVEVEASIAERSADSVSIKVSVSGSGEGMPAEAMKTLFEPFLSDDPGGPQTASGSGLELSVCKKLVELMGGTMGAETAGAARTCLWMVVPFQVEHGCAAPDYGQAEKRPAAGGLTEPWRGRHEVLVAEDSPLLQSVVIQQLLRLGVSAKAVSDGRQALEAVRGKRFSLILMDLQMPHLDGYETAAAIREYESSNEHRTPIVAMTASISDRDRDKALGSGMDDFVTKPVSIEQLRRLLSRWLRP